MIAKYLLAWLLMIVIGISNGVLREATYAKRLPELRAHQLSTLIGMLFLSAYVWFVISWIGIGSGTEAISMGLFWLVLTVAFEFLFGHFVAGQSCTRLLRDYNLLAGRLWALFLV